MHPAANIMLLLMTAELLRRQWSDHLNKQAIKMIGELLDRRELIDLGAIPLPPSEPHLLVADVSRLNEEVGWAMRYELAAGLKQITDGANAREYGNGLNRLCDVSLAAEKSHGFYIHQIGAESENYD